MNPSLPFGPPDAFYFEAFTQDEAFMALDAENRRRGFGTAPTSAHAAHATSSSCTSYPAPLKRLSQSVDNSMHCMPAAAGQQKRARQPEQPPPDPNLLFVRPWCREEVRVGRAAAVRKYVAASYLSMWERTQASLANSRHFYEIVRDSTPCHIYFDLEFATADNRKVDRNAMVDCLLNIVASLVKCASSPSYMHCSHTVAVLAPRLADFITISFNIQGYMGYRHRATECAGDGKHQPQQVLSACRDLAAECSVPVRARLRKVCQRRCPAAQSCTHFADQVWRIDDAHS